MHHDPGDLPLTDAVERFARSHAVVLASAAFAMVLTYFFALSSKALSFDEEWFLTSDRTIEWIEEGRPVVPLVNLLFATALPQPGLDMAMALAFLFLSGVLWLVLFDHTSPQAQPRAAVLVFLVVFTTLPLQAYFLSYDTFSVAVALGNVWAALAAWFAWRWASERRGIASGPAALGFAFLAAGTYQSLAMAIVAGVLIAQLTTILGGRSAVGGAWRAELRLSVRLAAPAVTALIVAFLISMIAVMRGEHFDDLAVWGDEDLGLTALRLIMQPIVWTLGFGLPWGWVLIPTTAAAIYLLMIIVRQSARRHAWYPTLLLLVILGSPFALLMALGGQLPTRSLQALPLVAASLWLLLPLVMPRTRALPSALLVVAIMFTIWNANLVTTLFMTEHNIYERDREIAARLVDRLVSLGWDETEIPIVSVGDRWLSPVEQLAFHETFGRSFYNMGWGDRTSFFLRAIGYPFSEPTREQVEAAIERSATLPAWPAQGSVVLADGLAIVRFGDEVIQ